MNKRLLIALIVLYAVLFLVPLALRPVSISDEARYAEIPREMLDSGDWVVPRLNGIRYFEKPVLGYWLTAASIRVFGHTPFALRFVPAASLFLTALLIYWLVRRETHDAARAFLGSAIYATSALPVALGHANILDGPLTLLTTGALVFFYAAYRDDTARKGWFLVLFGLSCGLAFMMKGFLAFAVPVVVIVPFLLWERRFKDVFRLALVPVVVAALTVLPWAVLVHLRESDFWHYFFWVEHIQRFASDDPQHPSPFWYFVPILLGGLIPWTFVMPPALAGLMRKDTHKHLMRFAACWCIMPFLFFSASSGKLATYILPCFPPLAILTAYGLLSYFRQGRYKAFRAGAYLVAVLAGVGALVVLVFQVFPSIPVKLYSAHEGFKLPLILVSLAGASLAALAAARAQTAFRRLLWYALIPAAFLLLHPFVLPGTILATRSVDTFLPRYVDRLPEDTILVSDANRFHATCWFFRRDDVYVHGNPGELEYGFTYEDSKDRLLDIHGLRELLRENRGRRAVTLVTCRDRFEAYRHVLPQPVFAEEDHTLDHDRTLLIALFE